MSYCTSRAWPPWMQLSAQHMGMTHSLKMDDGKQLPMPHQHSMAPMTYPPQQGRGCSTSLARLGTTPDVPARCLAGAASLRRWLGFRPACALGRSPLGATFCATFG